MRCIAYRPGIDREALARQMGVTMPDAEQRRLGVDVADMFERYCRQAHIAELYRSARNPMVRALAFLLECNSVGTCPGTVDVLRVPIETIERAHAEGLKRLNQEPHGIERLHAMLQQHAHALKSPAGDDTKLDRAAARTVAPEVQFLNEVLVQMQRHGWPMIELAFIPCGTEFVE